MNKRYFFLTIALILCVLSCTDIGTKTKTFKVVNDTEEQVSLFIYMFKDGKAELVLSESITGKGLIVERTLETDMRDQNTPEIAFQADSVSVIFNNERTEAHSINIPYERYLWDTGKVIDDRCFTYTITQENYDNAIPCDGACN